MPCGHVYHIASLLSLLPNFPRLATDTAKIRYGHAELIDITRYRSNITYLQVIVWTKCWDCGPGPGPFCDWTILWLMNQYKWFKMALWSPFVFSYSVTKFLPQVHYTNHKVERKLNTCTTNVCDLLHDHNPCFGGWDNISCIEPWFTGLPCKHNEIDHLLYYQTQNNITFICLTLS